MNLNNSQLDNNQVFFSWAKHRYILKVDGKQTKGCVFFVFHMTKTNWTVIRSTQQFLFLEDFKHYGSLFSVLDPSETQKYFIKICRKETEKKIKIYFNLYMFSSSYDRAIHWAANEERKQSHWFFNLCAWMCVSHWKRKTIAVG